MEALPSYMKLLQQQQQQSAMQSLLGGLGSGFTNDQYYQQLREQQLRQGRPMCNREQPPKSFIDQLRSEIDTWLEIN